MTPPAPRPTGPGPTAARAARAEVKHRLPVAEEGALG